MPSKNHRPSGRNKPDTEELDALANLYSQGRFAEAETLALSLTIRFPRHGFGWKVLGAIYQGQNRFEDSYHATQKAIALLPDDAATHNNLGAALLGLERLADAEVSIRKALTIAPDYARALNNLGTLLRRQGNLAEAEAYCRRAVSIEPGYTIAHLSLGNALELQNKNSEAIASYRAALVLSPELSNIHSDMLHLQCHDVHVDAVQLQKDHWAFGKQFDIPLDVNQLAHDNSKDATRCLQVGFVSSDLYNHALANFLEPLFQYLAVNPTLSIHLYYTNALEDAVTLRMRNYFAHWHTAATLTDAELANKIRCDKIDILVDLNGHTVLNRLLTFAQKPAPVQVSWLGYLGTTGLRAMDYYLCDPYWIPPGQMDWQFTEKLAYLPAAVVFQPNPLAPPVNELPALKNGYITFGSFNRHSKINHAVVALWSMLLRKIPDSRLVLGAIAHEHQDGLRQCFDEQSIARSRLTFFSRVIQTDYLALHHQVDFCLDTFPFGGGATTAHAAWMGVPTLCLVGDSPASRFGAAEMHLLGLDEFIGSSIEDFVSKGCYWAQNVSELADVRQGLRARFKVSALGQTQQFSDHFATMLRMMWARWCNDLPPTTLVVEDATQRDVLSTPLNTADPAEEDLKTLSDLHDQQRHDEAESLARRLVGEYPEHGLAWKILGSTLHARGRLKEALEVHQLIAQLRPNDYEAHFNLACELQQQGQFDEAVKSYVAALGLQSNNPAAYNNLGNIFKTMGLFSEAEMYCRQAIALLPTMEKAHNNLGNALHAQGKYAQAQASYQQALALRPEWAEAYNNLAITLKDRGYGIEAKEAYRTALRLKPEWAAAHSNLLYCLSLDVHTSPQELHAQHLAFGAQFEAPLRAGWLPHGNSRDPGRLLQIGFVSGDLYDHALTNFLEPLFTSLAKLPGLELHAYYTHIYDDAVTQRIRASFAHWCPVAGLDSDALAGRIRADGIDILIDLCGHTAHNRLLTFARKPAPIQASWLGYLGTTGLQAMDYYLCDRFWVPPGELDWQFVENLAYLPAAVVFQPSALAPPVNPLPALSSGHITFGSFNRPNKLNASVIVLWAMLLREIPSSNMVLGGIPLESQAELLESFGREGIEHSRLTFFARSNLPSYLALHHQVDFCLDTFPYGGGATNAHAAWMGVPTLCLAGDTPASRFGAVAMNILGLHGFIASSIEDYLSKGRYWAEHVDELAAIRRGMREQFTNSPMGQPTLFAENFAALMRTMWQRWCDDSPAVPIEASSFTQNLAVNAMSAPTAPHGPSDEQLTALTEAYDQQRYADAQKLSQALLERFPTHGFVWKMLATIFQTQGQYEASLPALQQAIALEPQDAALYNNLGTALSALNRHAEAESCLKQAIAIAPDYGRALVNLGMALRFQGRLQESESCCRRALELDACDASAHIQLGNALEDQGLLSEAQACYYRADMAHEPRRAVAHSNVLYLMNHDVLVEPKHLFGEHVAFGEKFETPLRAGWQGHCNVKDADRNLKIGFVSGDFHHHALNEFLEPAFRALADRPSLTLCAYSNGTRDDEVTRRMRGYFAHWSAVGNLTDEDLATQIRADAIDILIDLSGHTAKNRLLTFARKPAPIQMSWLGYLGTTGLTGMDYYLCDEYWIPPGEQDWQFVEKMAYLPSAVTFKPSALSPPVSALPALKHGALTFGSFNRANKINSSVIALWSMLLRSIPSSCLLLGAVEIEAQEAMLQSFAAENITKDRLAFCPRLATEDYLALHHEVDICLDTFPHAGGATTANAAWMGVPTLGLAGETPASRFSATLMHQLGLDDFVAGSIEEFVHIGRYWAENLDALAQLRTSMRKRFALSLLGQPEEFADTFESMLGAMWQGWCNGDAVQSITIVRSKTAITNHMARVESIPPDLPSVVVVSASKLSESVFWAQSALGLSLRRLSQQGEKISTDIAFENARGLPVIFNAAIERAKDNDILVFVHDDVWIDEYNFSQKVAAGLQQFDVIGVAGNRHRVPNQPAWCFVDQKFTWDDKNNLSGRVAHGKDRNGQVTVYGPAPVPCELLDGVFMAVRCSTLKDRQVHFDAQFDFHFYDLDFCRSASLAGLRLGSWLVALTHQSGGAFGTSAWQLKYALYAAKWGEPAQPIGETARRTQDTLGAASADPVAEALVAAAEFEATAQFDYAIKVYEEILKFDSSHGETLYRLGKVAQRLNAYPQAAQHLQSAVQSDPSSEKYWLGFIHHLMMTQKPDVVRDAIELGQNQGLTEQTAGVLQTILASDTHAKAKKRAAICSDMTNSNASQPTVKYCPVCNNDLTVFLPLSLDYQRTYALFNQAHPIDRYETLNLLEYACPHCTASDRDRLMASYFLHDCAAGQGSASRRILEIAPSRPLGHLLRSHCTEYRSADLFDPSAMDCVDITDMNIYPEGRFDWVICSHVLEHVMDDAAALREIHRIMAPGGKAMLLVPIPRDLRKTDELSAGEDASEAERIRRFGQNDHIRMYAKADFASRIRAAGFELTLAEQTHFPAGTFEVIGLMPTSCLYVAVKPKSAVLGN